MKIKKSSKMLVSVTGLVVGLLLTIAIPAAAAGSPDKATGSGTWTNVGGAVRTVDFNAHEPRDGKPAKGTLVQAAADGSFSFTVDVDDVTVYEDLGYACFGGYITAATGTAINRIGDYRWTMVKDGGEGADAEDYLQGRSSSEFPFAGPGNPPGFCLNGNPGANEAFSGGNVQIHAGKSYE